MLARSRRDLASVFALLIVSSCQSGERLVVAGPPAKLALTTSPSASAQNRVAFATQPVVQLQDENSNPVSMAGITITAAISSGGGELAGTVTAQTSAAGMATFTNLSIQGTVGPRTLTFSAPGLTPAVAQVTTTPGAPHTLTKQPGTDNQAALPGTAVSIPPAVRVSDIDGNGIPNLSVTFAVGNGGGSITGASQTTNADGVATLGSWTLGSAEGLNTLAVTAGILLDGFTATSTTTLVLVSNVAPATITSGESVTITGSGFSATPGNNVVTIDGVSATVTSASATTLTVTAPVLPCTSAHNADIVVTVAGVSGSKSHPVQAATQHSLGVGGSVILSTSAAARCNELHNAGTSASYYVTIYNTNTTYSTTGAAFELRGASEAVAAAVAEATATQPEQSRRGIFTRRSETPEDRARRAHLEHLENELRFLRSNAQSWRAARRRVGASSMARSGTTVFAVGDAFPFKLRDQDANNGCTTFFSRTGRVVYHGTKAIIVEDNANALAGTIDTTYQSIGQEYDNTMATILETNFGNPLANDATLDNNQRIVMIFSNKVREMRGGAIAGFVTAADLFPVSSCASSNVGEFFYANAPQQAGTITTPQSPGGQSPPVWRWVMRGTVIHEVKHIVSVTERMARGGLAFEESWLEETTARIAEELYDRTRYSFVQRGNTGYGSAANPVGPYCGVRACNQQPRGIIRVFEDLAEAWYTAPHNYSPLGRIDANDFSFYATGWSLVRWTLDANAGNEATLLKALTQEPSKTGIQNFESVFGTTFVAVQPRWIMSMVVDDYPGLTLADVTLRMPSWNLRDVYAGYDTDFSVPWVQWPLSPTTVAFGNFSRTGSVRPGTAAIIQISGPPTLKQLIELKAEAGSAAAPAELRIAIVRIQ
jgi:hypothetical protein